MLYSWESLNAIKANYRNNDGTTLKIVKQNADSKIQTLKTMTKTNNVCSISLVERLMVNGKAHVGCHSKRQLDIRIVIKYSTQCQVILKLQWNDKKD